MKLSHATFAIVLAAVLVVPAPAQAAALTTSQINAVVGLLSAFGVDATTVANVRAALQGSAPQASTNTQSGGTVIANVVSLLAGGTTRAGATVPVIYIQLSNTSDKPVSVQGFTIAQRGTAPASAFSGFSTIDDKGGSQGVGGALSANGTGFVATNAIIEPRAIKLFTIKATLSSRAAVGGTVLVDVTSVETGAKVSGLPLRGATWVVGL